MTSVDFKIVHQLASELSAALVKDERTNGDKFTKLRDGSPQWMTDVIHEAHGDKLPDDYVYWFCEKAADAMAEVDEDDADEDRLREAIEDIEPPCYTHEQMKWLAGNYEYCDQAIEKGLWTSAHLMRGGRESYHQVTDLVAIGMQLHIQEVGCALLQAIIDHVEEMPTCDKCGEVWLPTHTCE